MNNTQWLEQMDNEREAMLAASPKCDDCGQAIQEGFIRCDSCQTKLIIDSEEQFDDPIDTYGMDYPE